jgi:hypothetical protein
MLNYAIGEKLCYLYGFTNASGDQLQTYGHHATQAKIEMA